MLAHYKRYLHTLRHYFLTVSFVIGFIVDNLTLGRIDQLFGNAVLLGYIFLSGGSLFILYAAAADRVPERTRHFALTYIPFLVQFSFGGLLSGMLVFYSKSGSWYTSWPYLLVLLAVILGNEFLRDRVGRLLFNLVIFFVGSFSYFVLIVPVLLKKMGAGIFVASGIASLVFFLLYLRLLRLVVPKFIEHNMRMVVFTIGMVFALLNFLYFGNLIPPIPLAAQTLGIFHTLERPGGNSYVLTYEKGAWYEFWKNSDTTFHYTPGDRVYCFASIFAPTEFNTEIYHRWEYFDETKNEWVDHGRIPYAIAGGSDRGFRGFTFIESVREGKWRCTVETGRGQALGRAVFTAERGNPPHGMTTVTH